MQPGSTASKAAGQHHTYQGQPDLLGSAGRGQARQGPARQQTDRPSTPAAAAVTTSRTSKCWLYRATLASTCARRTLQLEGSCIG